MILKIIGMAETSAVVCVTKGISINGIEELMNQFCPLLGHAIWTVSDLPKFGDGSDNPSPCHKSWEHGENRLHYMMIQNNIGISNLLRGDYFIEA